MEIWKFGNLEILWQSGRNPDFQISKSPDFQIPSYFFFGARFTAAFAVAALACLGRDGPATGAASTNSTSFTPGRCASIADSSRSDRRTDTIRSRTSDDSSDGKDRGRRLHVSGVVHRTGVKNRAQAANLETDRILNQINQLNQADHKQRP